MTKVFSNMIRGVALGDAWGHHNEFRKIEDLTKNDPKGPAIPGLLGITDDTQMTLYLAQALDESWDQPMDVVKKAIMEAFLAYNVDPDNNRAPGVTVTGSLSALKRLDGDWKEATNPSSDGSGTVMRTSPTAFLPEDLWVGVTAFAAAVTHGKETAIAAAILNAAILREILADRVGPGELLQRALTLAKDPNFFGLLDTGEWLEGYPADLVKGFDFLVDLIEDALEALPELKAEPWALKSDPSLRVGNNSGWRSPHTLVIALLAADMLPGEPLDALRRSVTTDGDSDTIGAVAGAILGALYPKVFTVLWDASLRQQFEPRYVRWIENEVDDYPPAHKGWFARMLRRAS